MRDAKEAFSDLRAMVRDVLREAIAARNAAAAGLQATHRVRIANDRDLQAFIARLASPGVIEAVRSGSLKFGLAVDTAVACSSPAIGTATSNTAFDGVVAERMLAGFASGSTIRITASAVLTPLAKDLACRKGINFERIG